MSLKRPRKSYTCANAEHATASYTETYGNVHGICHAANAPSILYDVRKNAQNLTEIVLKEFCSLDYVLLYKLAGTIPNETHCTRAP